MNIFTRKSQLSLYALVACTLAIFAPSCFGALVTVNDAKDAITALDKKTLADYFPIEEKQAPGSKDVSIDSKEEAVFEADFQKHLLALQKVGFLDADKYKQCWKTEEQKYINPATIRELKNLSTGEMIGASWLECLKKHPDPRKLDDWIDNLVKNDGVAMVAGGAGTVALYLVGQFAGILKQAVAISLIGDLIRAYTEPVMGPLREFAGVNGKRTLQKPSVMISTFFAKKITAQQKNLDRLDRSQELIEEAQKLANQSIYPGLSEAELKANFERANRLFIEAVQVWGTTLTPNSQSGRSLFMDGTILRSRDYTGTIAGFDGKMESYRQGITSDLPKAFAAHEAEIEARRLQANDQIQLLQASNNPDKEKAIQEVIDLRDQDIAAIEIQKKNIKVSLDSLLAANEAKRDLRHDMAQDSNIVFKRIEKILAAREVPGDKAGALISDLKVIRDQELSSHETTDAVIKEAHQKLSTLELPEDILDSLLQAEQAARKTAQESLKSQEAIIAKETKNLEELKVDPSFLADILARQKDMLLARQQLDASLAAQMLNDQLYPEFSRLAHPEVKDAFLTMRKEYGFDHYEEKIRERARRIIREMGFDIAENEDPKLDREEIITDLQQKLEQDRGAVIKDINQTSAEGMRDWLKFKLGLPSRMASELGKCPALFGLFKLVKSK